MTIDEAYNELGRLADGQAYCMTYELSSWHGVRITAYIAGVGHSGPSLTYSGAIANMLATLNMQRPNELHDPAPSDLSSYAEKIDPGASSVEIQTNVEVR